MSTLLERLSALQSAAAISGAMREPKGLFALLIVTVLVMYGLSVGRTRALVSLLSIYVAYMLAALFPYSHLLAARLPERIRLFSDLGLFFALYGVVFLLISHSMRRTRLSLGEISIVQVLLISVVQIGLLASITISLVPPDLSSGLLGPLRVAVAGSRALWMWAAASLLILPLMRSRSRE